MSVSKKVPHMYDVFGIGAIAVDDIWLVPRFPAPDLKVMADQVKRDFGGLTGTALVAAARLGARCGYGGLLGTTDLLSRAVEDNFLAEGVDVSPAVRRPDARPIHAIVIVGTEQKTRNIFFHISGPTGAPDVGVAKEFVERTRVLFVDQHGITGAIKAIELASAAGVEVVADIERDDDPLTHPFLDAVGHLILPEAFALRVTGAADAAAAISQLWSVKRRAVVVTCGERGCWWSESHHGRAGPVNHLPAFKVEVLDTTGCGDVFHGAYAIALSEGRPMVWRVRFASAAAALKAARVGGQAGIPRRSELMKFLREKGASL